MFPFGKTLVTCTSTDPNSGATAVLTFNVTVQDATPPAFTQIPTSITVGNTAPKGQPQGAVVDFANQLAATDLVDGPVTPTANPPSGSFFPAGNTTVTVTATDHAGNHNIKTFIVNVAKKAPKAKTPTITVSVSPASINEGQNATFTISASAASPAQPLVINYTVGGTALFGSDFILKDQFGAPLAAAGSVMIPSGGRTVTITLNALTNVLSSGNEAAQITIDAGSGYSLGKVKKGKNPDQAIVTINNTP
jgi:hypothetical protein